MPQFCNLEINNVANGSQAMTWWWSEIAFIQIFWSGGRAHYPNIASAVQTIWGYLRCNCTLRYLVHASYVSLNSVCWLPLVFRWYTGILEYKITCLWLRVIGCSHMSLHSLSYGPFRSPVCVLSLGQAPKLWCMFSSLVLGMRKSIPVSRDLGEVSWILSLAHLLL